MTNCPMCGLSEEYQEPSEYEGNIKVKCKGCGTIFFDKSKFQNFE